MHTVASIQARLGSTRLPGKVLLHLGGQRILHRVVDRVNASDTVNQTIVAIGDNPENEAIMEFCRRNGIDFIVGSEDNLLARHLETVKETDSDQLVRITADCPFVPSNEIDRVVRGHLDSTARYTTNVTDNMPVGIGVDVIDPNLLGEFETRGETHPVKLAREHPGNWRIKLSNNPRWKQFSNVHMAIDTPDDYWSLIDAADAVGDDPMSIAKWLSQ